ncbi:nucleotidyl transferase AbiEii/AbiGii toxin family protein [Halomonas sp. McH1-25]|uniref:nucleotidyl transferase AbiEii/AbiGii toxin family protein n=1 Tax=unclassified Halomonas TaxID=2609666 RepID=UPI001EF53B17|nr:MULTISPECIES: nucleotidyl transferase AbiEii/AbiGii toxin family protein [unclassified Halomonas]MCG7602111.1 nucleotidyl transferase AbiEii/AbiGii toxin family protein [Halomonas sp. McH1-25]MCP1343029.1 nucleotidyl transferase AbiEii/AbiGii toxin family protein [Halomonas sp. FL8]MCP1362984.1 nucleotidyl transferase AbiEii/AbiGii toxin family protein [Halomonas sp. BBD45]MCP1364809.1 nucleotidyl transferase AbiEii/AbiGii toxin family protein [Halomonas sp. BBD48]
MSATSLTLSVALDEGASTVLSDGTEVLAKYGIDYVLIGATARDIILHYYFGAPIRRATADIDFAIYVRGWDEFQQIQAGLIDKGYQPGRDQQELRSPVGYVIDIIPFGGVANADNTISWPPKGHIEMSVVGFEETCQTAYRVTLPGSDSLVIKVANLECQVLLKLIAWTERAPETRRKDAADIAYLLQNFVRVDADRGTLYEGKWVLRLEENGYDTALTAMQLLGERARCVATAATLDQALDLLNDRLPKHPLEILAVDMSRSTMEYPDSCLQWLETLRRGLESD